MHGENLKLIQILDWYSEDARFENCSEYRSSLLEIFLVFLSYFKNCRDTSSKTMNASYYILFLLFIIPTLDVG